MKQKKNGKKQSPMARGLEQIGSPVAQALGQSDFSEARAAKVTENEKGIISDKNGKAHPRQSTARAGARSTERSRADCAERGEVQGAERVKAEHKAHSERGTERSRVCGLGLKAVFALSEKRGKSRLIWGGLLLFLFALWTLLVCMVDVSAVGESGASVGFSTLNGWFHRLVGFNEGLYILTDIFGLVPIGTALGFALLGVWQWVRRGSLWRVDSRLFVLGAFYIAVIGAFLLFEVAELNYRPVLIDGVLEPSYPSSTTLLVCTVMPTASSELKHRAPRGALSRVLTVSIWVFTALTVLGRVFSGVHWLTDIIGGALLGAGLVLLHSAFEPRQSALC